jgi:hypothetical protein
MVSTKPLQDDALNDSPEEPEVLDVPSFRDRLDSRVLDSEATIEEESLPNIDFLHIPACLDIDNHQIILEVNQEVVRRALKFEIEPGYAIAPTTSGIFILSG